MVSCGPTSFDAHPNLKGQNVCLSVCCFAFLILKNIVESINLGQNGMLVVCCLLLVACCLWLWLWLWLWLLLLLLLLLLLVETKTGALESTLSRQVWRIYGGP